MPLLVELHPLKSQENLTLPFHVPFIVCCSPCAWISCDHLILQIFSWYSWTTPVVCEVLAGGQFKLPCISLTMLVVCRKPWGDFRSTNLCPVVLVAAALSWCCPFRCAQKQRHCFCLLCNQIYWLYCSLAWNCKHEHWCGKNAPCSFFTEWVFMSCSD